MTKTIIIDGKETHYTISDKGEVFNEKKTSQKRQKKLLLT